MSARTPFVCGNWKMNGTVAEAEARAGGGGGGGAADGGVDRRGQAA